MHRVILGPIQMPEYDQTHPLCAPFAACADMDDLENQYPQCSLYVPCIGCTRPGSFTAQKYKLDDEDYENNQGI